jgi:alpha-L-fucosidase 2
MLMQSEYQIPDWSSSRLPITSIELLPALPDNWKDGEVSGLRARGGITVGMTWQDGKVKKVSLTAQQPCVVTLLMNGERKKVELKRGENYF